MTPPSLRQWQVGSVHVSHVVSLVTLLVVSACSELTDVKAPDVITPEGLDNPAGAEVLRAGAVSSFITAFGVGPAQIGGQVATTGAMSDEFFSGSPSFDGGIEGADRRAVPEPSSIYPYHLLHRARIDALLAVPALERNLPTPAAYRGELLALVAFVETFFAENMCSGIPLGAILDGQPVYGQPLTIDEMLERAVTDFDTALVYATDSTTILHLAQVGRARALLNLGRFSDAATGVSTVPTEFTYLTTHSADVQPNLLFDLMNTSFQLTVADVEGGNGLDFQTANDPRVPTRFVGPGSDGETEIYAFDGYSSPASPIVLASGTEARLIEAEAAIRSGDAAAGVAKLNELRAGTPGLAPLALELTEAEQVDQLFRERAFWLFATGHRHGDLRRLIRQYAREVETVFPTGPYKTGQVYGSDVTFAPDESQTNNPSFSGCQSRGP